MAPSRAETQPSSEGRWEIRIVARGMLDDQMPVLVQDQGRSRKAPQRAAITVANALTKLSRRSCRYCSQGARDLLQHPWMPCSSCAA